MPGTVFKTVEGSGNRLLVGSIPIRSRQITPPAINDLRLGCQSMSASSPVNSEKAFSPQRWGLNPAKSG